MNNTDSVPDSLTRGGTITNIIVYLTLIAVGMGYDLFILSAITTILSVLYTLGLPVFVILAITLIYFGDKISNAICGRGLSKREIVETLKTTTVDSSLFSTSDNPFMFADAIKFFSRDINKGSVGTVVYKHAKNLLTIGLCMYSGLSYLTFMVFCTYLIVNVYSLIAGLYRGEFVSNTDFESFDELMSHINGNNRSNRKQI